MAKYPEHEKLAKISDKSQAIGEFLKWLASKGAHLCEIREDYWGGESFMTISQSSEDLLAEFFGIDLKVIEKEKRTMLEECRQGNQQR